MKRVRSWSSWPIWTTRISPTMPTRCRNHTRRGKSQSQPLPSRSNTSTIPTTPSPPPPSCRCQSLSSPNPIAGPPPRSTRATSPANLWTTPLPIILAATSTAWSKPAISKTQGL
jgi:hypothetical protein